MTSFRSQRVWEKKNAVIQKTIPHLHQAFVIKLLFGSSSLSSICYSDIENPQLWGRSPIGRASHIPYLPDWVFHFRLRLFVGQEVEAVFGFCSIRNFGDATDVLKEKARRFQTANGGGFNFKRLNPTLRSSNIAGFENGVDVWTLLKVRIFQPAMLC